MPSIRKGLTQELQVRIGTTLYYGFVFALAIHRCAVAFSGRAMPDELSYLHIAVFAGLTLASWWLLGSLRWMSDRIAAFLYGLFYAVRIGTHFARGAEPSMLVGAESVIITAGMIAMIVGVIRGISQEQPTN